MGKKNEIIKLTDGVYQIKYYWLGIADVYAYLILGRERGLLIDTCYSITHISEYVKQVTDLPIDVVNTHGHFDHIGGNSEFEQVYMSKKDWKTAKEHSDYTSLKKMFDHFKSVSPIMNVLLKFKYFYQQMDASLHMEPANYMDLPECGYFDLGNRKVSFIETPGHTQGSICLFDDKSKYLFVGDMACEEGVLLAFDHSTSVTRYLQSIKEMRDFYHANKGVAIIPSHHKTPTREDVFERYISICEDIINGKVDGVFRDQGIGQGKVIKRDKLQIVYRIV